MTRAPRRGQGGGRERGGPRVVDDLEDERDVGAPRDQRRRSGRRRGWWRRRPRPGHGVVVQRPTSTTGAAGCRPTAATRLGRPRGVADEQAERAGSPARPGPAAATPPWRPRPGRSPPVDRAVHAPGAPPAAPGMSVLSARSRPSGEHQGVGRPRGPARRRSPRRRARHASRLSGMVTESPRHAVVEAGHERAEPARRTRCGVVLPVQPDRARSRPVQHRRQRVGDRGPRGRRTTRSLVSAGVGLGLAVLLQLALVRQELVVVVGELGLAGLQVRS